MRNFKTLRWFIPAFIVAFIVLTFPQKTLHVFASGIQALATVPAGGTGLTALTAHLLLAGNGTSPVTLIPIGTAGECLESNGAGMDPSFTACSGAGGGGITVYSGTGLTVTANTYFFPIGGGATPSTTEANVDIASPSDATVSNFEVQLSVALGAGNTGVFTWRKAGASQTLTCTITGAIATACSDTTHSFTVAQGDLVDIQLVTTGTIVVTPNIAMGVQYGTVNTVSNTTLYCADAAGSGTTYTCSLTPTLTAYSTGMVVTFVPGTQNTGVSTLNINGLGAISIIAANTTGSALVAADLLAGGVYQLEYDGTNFRRISGPDGAWTALSYNNSWADFGSGLQVGQYRKLFNGVVQLRGVIKGGTKTAGTTIFTMPTGYRAFSSSEIIFGFTDVGTEATQRTVRLDFGSAGIVDINYAITSTYIDLTGINFSVY